MWLHRHVLQLSVLHQTNRFFNGELEMYLLNSTSLGITRASGTVGSSVDKPNSKLNDLCSVECAIALSKALSGVVQSSGKEMYKTAAGATQSIAAPLYQEAIARLNARRATATSVGAEGPTGAVLPQRQLPSGKDDVGTPSTASSIKAGNLDDPYTAPIHVSQLNTRYDQGAAAVGTVQKLAKDKDIILLTEVKGDTLEHVTAGIFDTHEPYLGQGNDKGYEGEFSPIYFNRKKFDAVYTEHIQLNEKGDSGAGSAREANFVLLKDKQTGATILVANTHLDNLSRQSQNEGIEKIKSKIEEIKSKYPVDSVMIGGDFNRNPNDLQKDTGLRGANYNPQLGTFENGSNLDGILVSQPKDGTFSSNNYTVTDGGASDHNVVSRNISVQSHNDARKASLKPTNFGALLFDASEFHGQTWITGFGTTGPKNTDWNDRITSVKVSDETKLTALRNSQRDPKFNDPSNTATAFTGDVSNVGEKLNDSFSFVQVGPK